MLPPPTKSKQHLFFCLFTFAWIGTCSYCFGQDYKGFPRYTEVVQSLENCQKNYPNLVELTQIASSHENRMVHAIKISNSKTNTLPKPQILYVGATHGCEPLSAAILMKFIFYLLENYDTSPLVKTLLDTRELYFVPLLNPDGYERYWRGALAFKKNMNPNGGKAKGVDLNRNFGYQWGYDDIGSRPKPGQRAYRGTAAFSEPEAQGLRDFVLQHKFILSFSYHSFGNQLLIPYNYTKREPEDSTWYWTYIRHLATKNNYAVGNPKSGIIYTSNGDMDDWLYADVKNGKQKTLAITVELSKLFLLPLGGIKKHYKKVFYQNLFMPLIADDPAQIMAAQKLSVLEKLVQDELGRIQKQKNTK